jgi:hypothetical protein
MNRNLQRSLLLFLPLGLPPDLFRGRPIAFTSTVLPFESGRLCFHDGGESEWGSCQRPQLDIRWVNERFAKADLPFFARNARKIASRFKRLRFVTAADFAEESQRKGEERNTPHKTPPSVTHAWSKKFTCRGRCRDDEP